MVPQHDSFPEIAVEIMQEQQKYSCYRIVCIKIIIVTEMGSGDVKRLLFPSEKSAVEANCPTYIRRL